MGSTQHVSGERDPGRWILQLRFFMATARASSFRQAAKSLYLSEPALSRRIGTLERELGVQLFKRERRGVRLTEAGRVLEKKGQVLLDVAGDTLRAVSRDAQSAGKVLRLGVPLQSAIIAKLVVELASRLADVHLDVHEASSHHQVQQMLADDLDLAIISLSSAEESLDWITVRWFEYAMLVPPHHPTATAEEVPLRAFATDAIGFPHRQFHPEAHDYLVGCCREAGFEPVVGTIPEDSVSAANLSLRVVTTGAVHFVALDFGFRPELGATVVRLCDPVPRMPLRLAWRRGRRTAILERAIESVQDIVQSASGASA